MMEKCALIISVNESYQKGEKDLKTFTGIPVSHSTLQRLIKLQKGKLSTSRQGVQKITLDGGKVKVRNKNKGKPCYWKDYKPLCLDKVYCGALFQNAQNLID